jgi:hypothetical protein
MSLDDKFYPDDGTLLNKFDNYLVRSAGKVGEAYQHMTGKSYKDLVQLSYRAGTIIALPGIAALSVFAALPPIAEKILTLPTAYTYESVLEEELRLEASGMGRKLGKIARTILPTVAGLSFFVGYSTIKVGISQPKNDISFVELNGAGYFLAGIGMLPTSFGLYLSRAHLPDPPKKTVWQRMHEGLKEMIKIPNPLPQQSPVRYFSDESHKTLNSTSKISLSSPTSS